MQITQTFMTCKIDYHTIISKFMHNIASEVNDMFVKMQLSESALRGLKRKKEVHF